jgi:hypothetical protein
LASGLPDTAWKNIGSLLPEADNVFPSNVSEMRDFPHVGMRGKDLSSEYLPMFRPLKVEWLGVWLSAADDSPSSQEPSYGDSSHHEEVSRTPPRMTMG